MFTGNLTNMITEHLGIWLIINQKTLLHSGSIPDGKIWAKRSVVKCSHVTE